MRLKYFLFEKIHSNMWYNHWFLQPNQYFRTGLSARIPLETDGEVWTVGRGPSRGPRVQQHATPHDRNKHGSAVKGSKRDEIKWKDGEVDCARHELEIWTLSSGGAPCWVKVARDLAVAVYGSPIISLFVAGTRHSADMLMSYTVQYSAEEVEV